MTESGSWCIARGTQHLTLDDKWTVTVAVVGVVKAN